MRMLLLVSCFCPLILLGQINWKTLQQHSDVAFVYKVNAGKAAQYLKQDTIDVDTYLNAPPYKVFPYNEINENELAKGFYVVVKTTGTRLVAYVTNITGLLVYPVNNQHRVQLLLRDKSTGFIDSARVWVEDKQATYNNKAHTYEVRQKYPDDALVQVYTTGDTAFFSLHAKNEIYRSVAEQRREHLKRSKTMKFLKRLPATIASIFKEKRSKYIQSSGSIIFNQAKDKITDTVKLKAYIINSKKQYKKPVDLYLEYYGDGDYHRQKIARLQPSAPGAYSYVFPLNDTLPQDTRYTVSFQTTKQQQLLSNYFKLEDYLADDVADYQLRAGKDDYSIGDTIHLYASATDANGLSMFDGTARLILAAQNIDTFYKDSLYVADTLFTAKKALATEGETAFDIPAAILPNADLTLDAKVIFTNSNNEMQEATTSITYKDKQTIFTAKQVNDSIVADYTINGKSVPMDGYLEKSGDLLDDSLPVHYPLHIALDPLADEYDFYIVKNETTIDSATVDIDDHYRLNFINISRKDTIGFRLQNKYRIPVTYTVFNGNTIVAKGNSNDSLVAWNTSHFSRHAVYTVRYQYWWAGIEQQNTGNMGYLYKQLAITVQRAPLVFPGQQDSIRIDVRDIHNKPAADVNLTAVAYNNQFTKDIKLRSLPNLAKYRSKSILLRDNFETENAGVLNRFIIGQHAGWVKQFSLDTLPYYNMLLPGKTYADYVTPLANLNTEVSVYVAEKGEPQEVFLLYINSALAYYNGVTDNMHNAYAVFPGYAKVGIRLYNRFIELDSIYLQPFYKHDLFVNVDHLPAKNITQNIPEYFTPDERRLLEKSIWKLANNYATNNSYVWQQQRIVQINSNQQHLVGPFTDGDSMHVYVPHSYDIHFRFEPGYEYTLSRQIERLEKKPLFPPSQEKIYLNNHQSTAWILGDTIPDRPTIDYTKPTPLPYIKTGYYNTTPGNNSGQLQLQYADTNRIVYTILYSETSQQVYCVLQGKNYQISNITPGVYTLLFVTNNFSTAQTAPFIIQPNATLCLRETALSFAFDNPVVKNAFHPVDELPIRSTPDIAPQTRQYTQPEYRKGDAIISGRVTDKKGGHGIAGASVLIKGTITGSITDSAGYFTIRNISAGKCTLQVSAVGFSTKEVTVNMENAQTATVNVGLNIAEMSLNEVVVVGYGTTRKKSLTGSVSYYNEGELYVNAQLAGKAAGLMAGGAPGTSDNVVLRGAGSTQGTTPVYVVDGIVYDKLPSFITPDLISNATILQGSAAVALYGEKAADGVVIITTNGKTLRKQFRDYAIWQPQLFTDKLGKAAFVADYPDNITGWQLYVMGIDKRKRAGKTVSFIQAYKPLSAQLSMPRFLVEGDSAQAVGKLFNYTADTYNTTSVFIVNNQVYNYQTALQPKSSFIKYYPLFTNALTDSLSASFAVQTTTHFKDAEERSIPVFKKGMEEVIGRFYMLDKDTAVQFTAHDNSNTIQLYVQNNTLQLLLDEIEHLKNYPYYCMEQTASKLRGLLMEKEIKAALKQPFTDDKIITYLVNKLQKAQLYEGGWSWWEDGKPNLYITNYVINALLPLRKDAAIENSIRNGLLYLQNQLANQNKDVLLQTLVTMGNAKHEIDYKPWIEKIPLDSLTQYQQWLYVKLKQQTGVAHQQELDTLLQHAVKNMLGSMYWGEQTWHWHDNTMASTTAAFEVLRGEPAYQNVLPHIIQYFLEERKSGYWTNTVESASVIATILPYILSQQQQFMQPATLTISGDTALQIKSFPYKTMLPAANIRQLQIQKSGGGTIYCTVYQNVWDSAPREQKNPFAVTTHFEKNGQPITALRAGEKVKLQIAINASKEADYVIIELPIPAGCTYSDKPQNDWQEHTEYIKNKMVLFTEHLSAGKHTYEVELEARYSGMYTLNPAKVSLMYFPTFYGNNTMRTVAIKEEEYR